MPSQLAKYRVDGETEITPEWWNRIIGDIDARFVGLEDNAASVTAVIDQLVQIGLTRINEVLGPAFEQIQAFAHLGDLLRASSASEVTIGVGSKTFIIAEEDRNSFAAPLYLIIAVTGQAELWMTGQVTSWDPETGVLIVDVTNTSGAGSHAAWTITVASLPPDTPPAQEASNVSVTPAGTLEANTVQEALEELDQDLAGKAPVAHGHGISEITGLQSSLAGKASNMHGHAIGDISGLQAALNGKSNSGHGHAIADISGLQSALNAAVKVNAEDQGPITGGAGITAKNLGTVSTGAITPDPRDRPHQRYVNNGAHQLNAPAHDGVTVVYVTNGGSAGAITTNGFDAELGDSFDTVAGNIFRCLIERVNGHSTLEIAALQ